MAHLTLADDTQPLQVGATTEGIVAAVYEATEVFGLPIARLSRTQTAELLIDLATRQRRGDRPWFATSANGHVVSLSATDPSFKSLMQEADVVNADGMPVRIAAHFVKGGALPERAATTDLFHDVAEAARRRPVTMFLLGASEEENARAVERMQERYPHLDIVGRLHGYHTDYEWPARIAEINALGPDILWVALGVPREQRFVAQYRHRMPNVGLVKTSGGLFNFLSGSLARAPMWMQKTSMEWAYRVWQEPRRLFWRHFRTSPHAVFVLTTAGRGRVLTRTLRRP